MQLSIEKLVDPVGYLPGKRCPYPPPPPPHPHPPFVFIKIP